MEGRSDCVFAVARLDFRARRTARPGPTHEHGDLAAPPSRPERSGAVRGR